MVGVGIGQTTLHELDHEVVGRVGVFVPVAHETNTGPDQDRTKDDEGESEVGQGRRTNRDEDGAEDQGQNHTYQQNALLVNARHRELGEDDGEDEDVVDRE